MLVHSYYMRDPRVRREAEHLAQQGLEVHVVCLREPARDNGTREPRTETVAGVHIHRVPLSRKRGGKIRYVFEFLAITVLGAWTLTRLHLKHRFRVVHVHNMPDILVAAGLPAKWTGTKLVLDVHDPMLEHFQASYHVGPSHPIVRALRFQERLSYPIPDRLVTVSDPMAENLERKGVRKDRISVVHNFPDGSLFPVLPDMDRWPRHPDRFTIMYSGTVTEHYRLDVVIRALARVVGEIPFVRLRILGEGNKLSECLALARELGVEERIEHLRPVPIEQVREVVRNADVGISAHQGGVFGDWYFSTKLVEFLTQGLPVVTSRTKTIDRYLPEDSVFYFEPLSVEGCARQLITVHREPELVRERLGNARAVVERLTWQRDKENLTRLYEGLLGAD
jgi:glycosyltransferase involved in cell wall biosynthesis